MNSQRNTTFDIMKGIGILLMMLCHMVYSCGIVEKVVYSFHMPLFFLLAGYFAKDLADWSQFAQYTSKNAKRLLLPYVITMLALCVWGGIQAFAKHDISCFLRPLFSMLSASADGWNSQWGLIYAGSMWFLVALFLVREIFCGTYLLVTKHVVRYKDEFIVGICIVFSVSSVVIHSLLPALPYCISQAFTAVAFYAVGWYAHKHSMPWWVYGLCICVWPIAIMYGSVDLAACRMKIYPLSFIGACGGTYVVYLLSKVISYILTYMKTISIIYHTLNISSFLAWCGRYTLPILCMHKFEIYSSIIYSFQCRVPQVHYLIGWGEVLIAIIMAAILIQIPYLKKVYV